MSSTNVHFDKNIAFIIGVANYEDSYISSLTTPLNDATLVADTLARQDFHVISDKDVTYAGMESMFYRIKQECTSERMRVVVYYAGHGIQKEDALGLKGYLLPSDAKHDNFTFHKVTYYQRLNFIINLNELLYSTSIAFP